MPLPEDLDDPKLLWTRASVLAVGAAADVVPGGTTVDDDGVRAAGPDGWCRVTLAPDGEAVLSGGESDGEDDGEGAPALDGLPERLDWDGLRDGAGYVCWYTGGAWHGPGGVDAPAGVLTDDDATIGELADDTNGRRAVADVLAKARENTLRPADVTAMLGVLDPDVGADAARTRAALDAAVRTGLLAGTKPPLLGEALRSR
ncbi:hypothetical protein [Actinomadura rifamycini]|uniref:hypothetical protein n=1 Tax=Actinomadura rifamycini TaxID=31962 RepID=UPI00040E9E9A|nr:hypothetical protein [Actinomadura rifamycini]